MNRPDDNPDSGQAFQLPTSPSEASLSDEFTATYLELRRLAHGALRFERKSITLSTTSLVNEAFLSLSAQDRSRWNDRRHFLNLVAMVMRRIVINHARERMSLKRGAGANHLQIEEASDLLPIEEAKELIQLDSLLNQLALKSERAARVVECRFYGGLSVEETAEALGIAPATVKRDWTTARAWLKHKLDNSDM